jgi:hypothetical protein
MAAAKLEVIQPKAVDKATTNGHTRVFEARQFNDATSVLCSKVGHWKFNITATKLEVLIS